MKKLNANEMRKVEGGWKASYTATCPVCGASKTFHSYYFGMISYLFASNSCKVAGGAWAKEHADNDTLRSLGF